MQSAIASDFLGENPHAKMLPPSFCEASLQGRSQNFQWGANFNSNGKVKAVSQNPISPCIDLCLLSVYTSARLGKNRAKQMVIRTEHLEK
jgi:hypothetical protein